MEKSVSQVEKNVSASFGYVKKDMLMLNDAFSDLHDKMQHLSLNHATLLEEIGRLRKDIDKLMGKKAPTPKKSKTVSPKKTSKKATKTNKKDDLTKIEGIGPSIQRLLRKKKIDTYRKLGNKTPEELRTLLEKEGPKYKMHNPTTWPKQARMAASGDWQELGQWQEKLKGGVTEK